MSVFGGDSWGREAQYRKRRVDDLFIEAVDNDDGSSYKKLSNGKFACLLCPRNPILDSPLMLSIHRKSSRHCIAESRLKERALMRNDEINKRLALSDSSEGSTNLNKQNSWLLGCKPLNEHARKAASEVLGYRSAELNSGNQIHDVKLGRGQVADAMTNAAPLTKSSEVSFGLQQLNFCERRERELKFIEAGWKRDCHGKWYKDENVEFDSDEEDPNVCLA